MKKLLRGRPPHFTLALQALALIVGLWSPSFGLMAQEIFEGKKYISIAESPWTTGYLKYRVDLRVQKDDGTNELFRLKLSSLETQRIIEMPSDFIRVEGSASALKEITVASDPDAVAEIPPLPDFDDSGTSMMLRQPAPLAPFAPIPTPVYHSLDPALHPNAPKLVLAFGGVPAQEVYQWFDGSPAHNIHAFSLDADDRTFNLAELYYIERIWRGVAERYAGFNIDVTTENYPLEVGRVVKVAIGRDDFGGIICGASCGGIAYVGAFTQETPSRVALVFPSLLSYSLRNIIEATAHELGHTLGLLHQSEYDSNGNFIREYMITPTSDGRSATMGAAYNAERAVWWNGFWGPNRLPQNDLAVLSGLSGGIYGISNPFGYRPADTGSSIATATPIQITNGGFNKTGIIAQNNEIDAYSISTPSGGTLQLQALVNPVRPALDLSLRILRSNGTDLVPQRATSSWSESLVTSLTPGTYYIFVSSAGNYGDLGNYEIVGSIGGMTTLPPAPTDLRVLSRAATSAQIRWVNQTAASDITYEIHRSSDGTNYSSVGTVAASQNQYTDSGLDSASPYFYKVRAMNASGPSLFSNATQAPPNFSVTPPSANPPATPSNLVATRISNSVVRLTWQDNAGNETIQEILRRTVGSSNSQWNHLDFVPLNVTTYDDNNASSSATFEYRVASIGDQGTSVTGPVRPGGPGGPGGPGPETDDLLPPSDLFGFYAGGSRITLRWSPRQSNLSPNAYEIQKSVDGGQNWERANISPATVLTYHDESIVSANTYYYRIRSLHNDTASAWSAPIDVRVSRIDVIAPITAPEIEGNSGESGGGGCALTAEDHRLQTIPGLLAICMSALMAVGMIRFRRQAA